MLDVFGVGAAGGAASAGAGMNIYVDDVACLMLLLTGLLLLVRHRKGFSRDEVPCLLLMTLMAVSVGRGISIFGLKQAGNGVRSLLPFLAPAFAVMLLRPVLKLDTGRLARWLGWGGSCLCAIALLRWAGVLAMPEMLEAASAGELREVVRCLNADYAILVGQAFIAAIYLLIVDRRSAWWWWAGAGMFGGVTLALQHRSVWTAVAAGVAWLAFRTVRLSPVRWLGLGATAIAGLGFLMVADPAIMDSARDMVGSGLTETQTEHSTWAWRVQGYTEATERVLAGSAVDLLIGPPAGWAVNTQGSFASTHIHSRFVDTLAYYGVVGVAALLVWFVVLTRRCRRRTGLSFKVQTLPRGALALPQALLISELIYFVPYTGGMLQSAVLGLLWIAATQGAFQQIGGRLAPFNASRRFMAHSAVEAVQQ
jgi:hypothetical protein